MMDVDTQTDHDLRFAVSSPIPLAPGAVSFSFDDKVMQSITSDVLVTCANILDREQDQNESYHPEDSMTETI